MNNMTKKLQKMIGRRKNSIIISKQKDFKPYKRTSESSSDSNYSPINFNNN